MHRAVRSGNQLGVVAEESTARKTGAGVERHVVNVLLHGEGLAAIDGLADEVIHAGIERVATVVVPADIHRPGRSRGGPGEEVMLLSLDHIVVHARDGGGCRAAGGHGGEIYR